ncbi:heparinase II/III family protein [Neorhizobium sp. JUb45]|uniref:heparinase II/III domain-containing protein n=1 Tax=unclassified Neorhizobium TaxID=2629175 RepID=UPI001050BDEE|nr:heparinase II/III family protein [Neorhizobium sp. JUb45]TCR03114.1 heparinase II/III-like protein [Neorhizobium sp. JUb45]
MFGEVAARLPAVLADFLPGRPIDDRETWNSFPENLRALVLADAEAALGRNWPVITAGDYRQFSQDGNRADFEALYFSRRRMLNDLVLGELLQNEGRFLSAIIDGIWLICEESGWQLPAHNAYQRGGIRYPLPDVDRPVIDLFAAETAALLSTIVAMMGSRLDAVIVSRIEREVRKRILEPYLTTHFWWMGNGDERMNNWTAWITQNVLLSTFSLRTDQGLRAHVAEKALGSLDAFIKDYADDGACEEGVVYYRHAALCMFGAMSILDTVAPGVMGPLWSASKIRNMAEYIVNMHVAGHFYFNFADSAAVIDPCTAREYLFGKAVGSQKLSDFAARDRATSERPHLPEEWNLWYRVQELLTPVAQPEGAFLPTDASYPGIGLHIARDENFALAVKGGNNGESHNHNDVGSVTLYKNGQPFLIDVGVETYTAKTFSADRYQIWTMQSAFHNLPTFGEVMQSDGAAFAARDMQAKFSPEKAEISLDIAPAYPPEAKLRSYRRTVTLNRGHGVETTDIHEGDLPATLSLMLREKPVVEGGIIHVGDLGLIEVEGGRDIQVETIEINDARLKISWPAKLYRLRVPFADTRLTLRIV